MATFPGGAGPVGSEPMALGRMTMAGDMERMLHVLAPAVPTALLGPHRGGPTSAAQWVAGPSVVPHLIAPVTGRAPGMLFASTSPAAASPVTTRALFAPLWKEVWAELRLDAPARPVERDPLVAIPEGITVAHCCEAQRVLGDPHARRNYDAPFSATRCDTLILMQGDMDVERAAQLRASGSLDRAIETLFALLQTPQGFDRALQAIVQIVRAAKDVKQFLASGSGINLLWSLMHSDNGRMRIAGARIAAEMGYQTAEAETVLRAWLDRDPLDWVVLSARDFAFSVVVTGRPSQLIRDRLAPAYAEAVRLWVLAAEGLGFLRGSAAARETLLATLVTNDPQVAVSIQLSALKALGALGDPTVAEEVWPFVKSGWKVMRYAALETLVQIGDARIVPFLQRIVETPTTWWWDGDWGGGTDSAPHYLSDWEAGRWAQALLERIATRTGS